MNTLWQKYDSVEVRLELSFSSRLVPIEKLVFPSWDPAVGRSSHTSAMAQIFMDLLSSLTNCLFCFPGSPQLKVNNRSFKLLRLLGEVRHVFPYYHMNVEA